MITSFRAAAVRASALASLLVLLTGALVVGCSRPDTSAGSADSSAAAPGAASTPAPAPGATSGDTTVRGTVASVTDTALTLSSGGGEVRVALAPPVQVYDRQPADLSRVTEHSFVGVTSVSQPDGSQRATEIHIFPEELRGLGEGSRPMGQPPGGGAGGGGSPSTMTNGTVTASGASRMTNGAVRAQAGGTLTVEYQGGSQTIAVPAGVPVTVLAPTKTPVAAGANVVVLAHKRPDGTLEASRVLLAPRPRP